ncbi:hypothetical protein VTJ04DRAFT_3323 [Mycothermus thermophilus]|uniref:uncharacterized protein n=1 Tax=Humicola insolens TaxID=85995 RepID=UPI0037440575
MGMALQRRMTGHLHTTTTHLRFLHVFIMGFMDSFISFCWKGLAPSSRSTHPSIIPEVPNQPRIQSLILLFRLPLAQ